ncbi:hypothetical protein COV81_05055 [Candidatus Peregrinibacteria bacterium CG11_big_fil_rev_8_21_14_0_20_41_10]|nr:MAG: hypothetical protein COV81_05055 [Candidatus Peregrinibacteria bacterium CG11_big_fil_rev_8_21_14_0_20_41_10]PIZ76196.1 MAG: hypothetical protein COY06_02220 [Candidatus Peregrinibacteria bacterium CG_4_10_14_0_2_um_filter_41_8]PJC37697.1 MAG: hypothetical protein CO045_04370 [Candidatus Peregrinibacteria bacterium CG_4_9_14_0_2_um_filter_41_14]
MHNRFLPNFSELLKVTNLDYLRFVQQIWAWWLESDRFNERTGFNVKPNVLTKMVLIAREAGVFAGGEELLALLGSKVVLKVADGDAFMAGDMLLELTGNLDELLLIERTIVNFIGRMSGIATNTHRLTAKLIYIKIASTRKTLWSLLDKKAVLVGGGLTHRLSYGQAMIVKDNDFAWMSDLVDKGELKTFFEKIANLAFVEVEVENRDQFLLFQKFASQYFAFGMEMPPLGIMFDNLKVDQFKDWLPELSVQVFREASGSINAENYLDYDVQGLDYISLGALTKNSYAIDLSLDLAKK